MRKLNDIHLRISVQIAAAFLGGASLHASVIALEDFEDKSLAPLNGQAGGSGFSGTWSAGGVGSLVNVINSNLSYANGAVGSDGGNQALQFLWSGTETISDGILSRALNSSQTNTVYMSMLFRDTANNDAPFSLGSGNDFVQWGFDNGTDGNPNATILRRNGELQARSNTTTANSAGSGDPSVLNLTRMLVFKATKGAGNYNSVSLFVDPSTLIETAPDAVSNFDSEINVFSHFVARSAFHDADDSFLIDNIRIGTTWQDVVTAIPQPPAAIPEPSTALLALTAWLGLFRRRR